jgi:hypothetical protein
VRRERERTPSPTGLHHKYHVDDQVADLAVMPAPDEQCQSEEVGSLTIASLASRIPQPQHGSEADLVERQLTVTHVMFTLCGSEIKPDLTKYKPVLSGDRERLLF